jgi:two-component system response regulator FixJ
MHSRQTISVVDDDENTRRTMRLLLEAADFVVRDYASAHEFLDADLYGAACVVTDLNMPGMDGLALQREIARRRFDLPVVVMSGFGRVDLAVTAMKSGAVDFIEKPFDIETMLTSIRRAIEIGERVRLQVSETKTARKLLLLLTPRERHVLHELVGGKSNKDAALALGISPRTVEVYRAQIMGKLQAQSVSELVRLTLAASRTLPLSF